MAKVNVEFDSIEKTCNITVDGQPLEDCKNISFGMCEDEWCMSLMCKMEDESSDMTTYTHVTAKDSTEAQNVKTEASVEKNGFIFTVDKKNQIRRGAYQLFSKPVRK